MQPPLSYNFNEPGYCPDFVEPDRHTLSAVILQLEPEREPARQHEQHGEKHAERKVHGHEELLRDHQNQEVAEPERPSRLEIRFGIGAAIGSRQTRRYRCERNQDNECKAHIIYMGKCPDRPTTPAAAGAPVDRNESGMRQHDTLHHEAPPLIAVPVRVDTCVGTHVLEHTSKNFWHSRV